MYIEQEEGEEPIRTTGGFRVNDKGVIDIPSGVAPGYPEPDEN